MHVLERTQKVSKKRTHTIPWGGRFRAHALGENPEGAPRDTPAGIASTLLDDRNRSHTSPLGREGQGARSRGEPRRCSKRHSRGVHNNTLARRKSSPTPVPWGERFRVHILERTQKVHQETLPRRTLQPSNTQEITPKTHNTGSRRQSCSNRELQTTKEKRPHTRPMGRKIHGTRSQGEPRRCSTRHSRGAHNTQSRRRFQGAQNTPRTRQQHTINHNLKTGAKQTHNHH